VWQVAAVILAAGEAKRFRRSPDETKLVAELDGKPIVRHVAEAALASRAHPVLVVTGHAHEQVSSALEGLTLERIHNRDPGAGLAASLKLAVHALPSTARGAVILLGDMPRIAPSLIDRLIDAFDATPVEPLAVVPVRGERRGNPALIGRGLFAAVRMLEGDKGARDLIAATRENIL
jgi:molybdenum cofactor cytidylyltransferase